MLANSAPALPWGHATAFQQALVIHDGVGGIYRSAVHLDPASKITVDDASRVRAVEMRPPGWLEKLAQELGEAEEEDFA